MSSQYSYDEQGQFFPYFTATFLAMGLVPYSIKIFKSFRAKKVVSNTSDFPLKERSLLEKCRKIDENHIFATSHIIVMIGWIIFAYMIFLIKTTHVENTLWDPYSILGISVSATEKEIRKHYKRLSLKFHPDKIRNLVNITKEEVESQFVELTKAYKVLTDAEIRRNFLEFGHPDGKQAFSIGIALPSWFVDGSSRYLVLAVYAILFGVLLPFVVGKWWYGTKARTKDGISIETASAFFKDLAPETGIEETIIMLAKSEELRTCCKDVSLQQLLSQLPAPPTSLSDDEKKAYLMIQAHLNRTDLKSDALNICKYRCMANINKIMDALMNIEGAISFRQPLLSQFTLRQSLAQAVGVGKSPLLQLPYITDQVLEQMKPTPSSVAGLLKMSAIARQKLLTSAGLTPSQVTRLEAYASKLPQLDLDSIIFKVEGEEEINPGSFVQIVTKLRCTGSSKEAFAPYIPSPIPQVYYLTITDVKQGRVIIPPFPLTNVGSEWNTYTLQFQAPTQVGKYSFVAHISSNAYLGIDIIKSLGFEIVEPSRIVEVDESESSESEQSDSESDNTDTDDE